VLLRQCLRGLESAYFGDVTFITGSAVALHCSKAHSKTNRKMENSTPCKIVTPENIILNLGTRDYVQDVITQFLMKIASMGASPQIGEI